MNEWGYAHSLMKFGKLSECESNCWVTARGTDCNTSKKCLFLCTLWKAGRFPVDRELKQ